MQVVHPMIHKYPTSERTYEQKYIYTQSFICTHTINIHKYAGGAPNDP